MTSYKSEIKKTISLNKLNGSKFAFMIDKGRFEQDWIVINFVFYEFKPVPKCNYYIECQHVKNGKFSLLESRTFNSIDSLIEFLAEKNVNPNYIRAIH